MHIINALRSLVKKLRRISESMRVESLFQPAKAYVRTDRQQRGGNGSRENGLFVDHSQATANILTQYSRAHCCRKGSGGYGDYRSPANPGEKQAKGEGGL